MSFKDRVAAWANFKNTTVDVGEDTKTVAISAGDTIILSRCKLYIKECGPFWIEADELTLDGRLLSTHVFVGPRDLGHWIDSVSGDK